MNDNEFFIKQQIYLAVKEYGAGFALQCIYDSVEKLGKTTEELLKEINFEKQTAFFSVNIDPSAKLIKDKIPITSIARRYGLKVDHKGMCICPFHTDKDPSLGLNDELGIFHCFGCHVKGDIIKFYQMLEKRFPNGKK